MLKPSKEKSPEKLLRTQLWKPHTRDSSIPVREGQTRHTCAKDFRSDDAGHTQALPQEDRGPMKKGGEQHAGLAEEYALGRGDGARVHRNF